MENSFENNHDCGCQIEQGKFDNIAKAIGHFIKYQLPLHNITNSSHLKNSEYKELNPDNNINYSFSGIVERYRRLHWSRRKGNTVKEKCLKNELIKAIPVLIRTGKVVLLWLTSMGRRYMRNKGCQINQPYKQKSLVHEYWKHKVAKHYGSLGYEVEIEKKVNGHTDLIIEKNGKRFAVEIETGKSNWRINMQRNINHGFQNIIIITTNDKVYNKLKKVKENGQLDRWVEICRAQDFL